MVVDGSPVEIAFLKFDLSTLAGKHIESARLRLKIGNDASTGTQTLNAVASTSWTERGLTYNNRPALGSTLATFAGSRTNTWIEVDITSYVVAAQGQLMSVAISEAGADSINFYAREASAANRPVLIVTASSP
jgi:hypothetical protein